jgi:hypothetical protein
VIYNLLYRQQLFFTFFLNFYLGVMQSKPTDSFGDLLGGFGIGGLSSVGTVAVSEVDGKAQDADASKFGSYASLLY